MLPGYSRILYRVYELKCVTQDPKSRLVEQGKGDFLAECASPSAPLLEPLHKYLPLTVEPQKIAARGQMTEVELVGQAAWGLVAYEATLQIGHSSLKRRDKTRSNTAT